MTDDIKVLEKEIASMKQKRKYVKMNVDEHKQKLHSYESDLHNNIIITDVLEERLKNLRGMKN